MNVSNQKEEKEFIGIKEIINLLCTAVTAGATAYIAFYTVSLSNIGQEANNQTKLNAMLQLRSYVIQDVVNYSNYDVSAVAKNVGQTPAVEVTSHARSMITDTHTIESFLKQGIDEDNIESDSQSPRSNMGPNGIYAVSPQKVPNKLTDGTFEKLNNFSQSEISDFVNGKKLYWMSGAIRYRDIYGINHRTRFCYYFEKTFDVRTYCHKNNDMN